MLQLRLNLNLVVSTTNTLKPNPTIHHSSPSLLLLRATTTTTTKTLSLSQSQSQSPFSSMADSDSGDSSPYQHALSHLSSLITTRARGDGSNRGNHFHLISRYLNVLELDEPLKDLKVIHVAGTKGKGSTCSFAESILRNCGLRTGLFTSPHLIDVRERFRLDGVEISEEKFLKYFWWCWDRLQEKTDYGFPMPTYFRFLALLAFKIFSAEQVDVAILEVGLGGRFDATNVVQTPVVCGVASLGYDHMEILGNTLGQIAGEKAGIFKEKVPAYTVPQPEEAMSVLEEKASKLDIPLHVSQPLDGSMLNGHKLGLDGEHQFVNAGLAVSLCRTWLKKTGHAESISLDDMSLLPEQFIRGLAMTKFPGRAQTVPDPKIGIQHRGTLNPGGLIFYLDGAHSPESMEMCARWFCNVIAKDARQHSGEQTGSCQDSENILLFNCMSVRDPQLLLPRLVNVCADNGIYFRRALFVPNQSSYNKVGSHALPANDSPADDLSWQQTLQRVWENLVDGEKGPKAQRFKVVNTMKSDDGMTAANPNYPCRQANSSVFPSLPLAIKWIRDTAQQNRTVRFQVLVTGSLHLVGDVLRLIKK